MQLSWRQTPRYNSASSADKWPSRKIQQDGGSSAAILCAKTPTRLRCLRIAAQLCVQYPATPVHRHSPIQSCVYSTASRTGNNLRQQLCTNRCTCQNLSAAFWQRLESRMRTMQADTNESERWVREYAYSQNKGIAKSSVDKGRFLYLLVQWPPPVTV